MRALIHKLYNALADAFFPKKCFSCSKKGKYLCQKCLCELRDPNIFYPRGANLAVTSFSYRAAPVKRALRKLKYSSAGDIASEFAATVAEDLAPYAGYFPGAVVSAIPMTNKRKRARGFNQAELLARGLAERLSLEYLASVLKIRETKPQAEIRNRKERLQNIKGAFDVPKNFDMPTSVIMVDDIITTGATMEEASRALKKAGVKKIICVAVAG